MMLIAVVSAAAVVLLGATVWIWWRGSDREKGIKQFARRVTSDPGYSASMSERLRIKSEAIKLANAAPPPADYEIPGLGVKLISNDEVAQVTADILLRKAGERAEASLLAMLDDPRCSWEPESDHALASSQAGRVVTVLRAIPSRELGKKIGHLAGSKDWRMRNPAAEGKAAMGTVDVVPFVIERLLEKDGSVEKGVELAVLKGWAQPEYIRAIADWAGRNVTDPGEKPSQWAVKFYAKHSGSEALPALRKLASVDNNRNIHTVLSVLLKCGETIPQPQLRQFIEKSLGSAGQWPWNCVFDVALPALAGSTPEGAAEARAIAETQVARDRKDGSFASTAISFIETSEGLPKSWQISPPDTMNLSASEKKIVSDLEIASLAFGEICNGGLSQFFFNDTGDRWRELCVAFRAIGFEQGAIAIEEASRLLHPEGAAIDRGVRMKQYASLSKVAENRLDELSGVFWGGESDRVPLRYMLRHAELFRRIKTARLAVGLDTPGVESGS